MCGGRGADRECVVLRIAGMGVVCGSWGDGGGRGDGNREIWKGEWGMAMEGEAGMWMGMGRL